MLTDPKQTDSPSSGLKWPVTHIDAHEYARQAAEAGEAVLAEIEKIAAHPDLTDDAKRRKVAELEATFVAKEQALSEEWEQRFAAWEQEAGLQAKPPKTSETEVFLLAQGNGLAALRLIASGAGVEELGRELEAVIERGLPGEVQAWAKNLPYILRQKVRASFATPEAARARQIEMRCQEAAESLKTDKQRRGEANLQLLEQCRREFRAVRAVTGMGNGIRSKVRSYRAQAN